MPVDAPPQALINHGRLLLLTQYSSRLPPRSPRFLWPPPRLLLHIQPFLAADLLGLDDDGEETGDATHRAEVAYQKSFLKELIKRIEEAIQRAIEDGAERDDWEVEDLLLSHYADLMAMPSTSSGAAVGGSDPMESLSAALPYTNHSTPLERHLSYYYPLRHPQEHGAHKDLISGWDQVHLYESSALVGAGTTALKTWEASLRLASHVLCNKSEFTAPGARVLELGSGTGLLSVVVAAVQREAGKGGRLCATDLPSIVRGKLKKTFEHNDVTTSTTADTDVQLLDLDWVELEHEVKEGKSQDDPSSASNGQASPTQALAAFAPNLILGADIIFDPSIISPLVTTIKCALEAGAAKSRAPSPQALVASTVRNVSTYSRFLALLDAAGLVSEEVELQRCVVEAPTYGQLPERTPPIVAFSSGHDEQREGTVKGLRIRLPS
ncbi:hypothetical protein BCV69DRAFT_13639 [Microstroma glucosiphilum]|uniref:S-adenosyl-L-methionine-dependent methyltransferase n=1 Tax=Pseudomicrostroma glucosiphilum TaxID=1684307 RepID=A0A316UHW3_9BASI|nr:hypothetical protein BCV69DRAFT_13639 [Pseudomicrostroma glucosiphilum]PWN23911.1 hypothetical protein BCV69DRAFT_13639 [Pseudomicrostroma glucosiphilum]